MNNVTVVYFLCFFIKQETYIKRGFQGQSRKSKHKTINYSKRKIEHFHYLRLVYMESHTPGRRRIYKYLLRNQKPDFAPELSCRLCASLSGRHRRVACNSVKSSRLHIVSEDRLSSPSVCPDHRPSAFWRTATWASPSKAPERVVQTFEHKMASHKKALPEGTSL